ncbi:MAG: nicotinamidase [Patescibacteria group bacterium]
MKKALLIVDVQKDFCPGGSLAVPNGDEVVKPLNNLAVHALLYGWSLFASRDWHPLVTKHFSNYGGIWPIHCVQNTRGAEFHYGLYMNAAGTFYKTEIVSKGVQPDEDGYSAFDGNCDQLEKPLLEVLNLQGITEIYIGGLATDYCVRASALDAVKYGFKTYLLLDACRAVNLKPGDGEKAVEEMKKAGVIITTTGEVMSGKV